MDSSVLFAGVHFDQKRFGTDVRRFNMTLHAGKGNKNAAKALIVAEYLGVKLSVPAEFQMGVSNKSPEFLKLNPLGKVPVLETPDGPISESNAIARYVAKLKESTLLGTTAYEAALIDQWIDFSTLEIESNIGKWCFPLMGYGPHFPEAEEAAIKSLEKSLKVLDDYLVSRTFLVGHSVTLADIILTCNIGFGFRTVLSKEFTAKYPHVERYYWTLVNQPELKSVLGEVIQGEGHPSKGKHSHVASPKPAGSPPEAKKPVAAPPKAKAAHKHKEAPKAKEAPKPKEVAADDEEEAPKPKAKNPLDLLPPSPFVIDNWKRLYSNTKAKDFAEVAIKGFWEMYDPEGWSFWFADYKYNEENDKTYTTMNKVGGFLQRLDFIRKYAFGKVLILGEQPPYKIKSVWLFRGPDIPKQVLDECYDVELYTWTKADLSNAEQKTRINEYFEEPDFVDGEKLLEAKCFK